MPTPYNKHSKQLFELDSFSDASQHSKLVEDTRADLHARGDEIQGEEEGYSNDDDATN